MKSTLTAIILTLLCFLPGCRGNSPDGPVKTSVRPKTAGELSDILKTLENDPHNLGLLTSVWIYYTQTAQYNELIEHARPVYLTAARMGDEKIWAYTGSYLAQSYLYTDQYDSMNYYLNEISDIVKRGKMGFLHAMNSNTTAIYAMKVEMDYTKSYEHFKTALDITRRTGNLTNEGILLCNIAYTYYLRNDTEGTQYAAEAYALGKDTGDKYVMGFSTMLMAKMLFLAGDHDGALRYARELLTLSEQPGQERHKLMANLICGDVFSKKGQRRQAEEHYNHALENMGKDSSSAIQAYLSYGNFLLDMGRHAEAKEIFTRGLSASDDKHNMVNRHDILLGLSRAYQGLGAEGEALEYYKEYHAHSDSIFNIQKERAFNSLFMRYERAQHQKEIREKELHLVKANRKAQITGLVLIVIMVIMGSIYMLYRRKNRMYRQLVEQHQEYLRREKSIKLTGRDERKHAAETDKTEEALYRQLENLMDSEHVYRHNDVSLDKLADMLQTNRAYVSRVINQYAGMSFYDYIHSRRISEAAAILSDPGNDIPLKALSDELGYNSMSAFYRYFQKETGVPPSKYREESRRLQNRSKPARAAS